MKDKMKNQVQKLINESPYDIGIHAESNNRPLFSYNENKEYESASCIKLYILIEYYRQVDEKIVLEETLIEYKKEDVLPGVNSGIIQLLHDRIALTTKDLATLMIVYSDNIATNKLIELLGINNINDTIQKLGLTKTKLHNYLNLLKYYKFGTTTPYEYAKTYQMLLEGKVINKKVSKKCLDILKLQQTSDMLKKGLPQWDFLTKGTPESSINYIASKSGTIIYNGNEMKNCRNDGGIISTKYGDYVIAIFISDIDDLQFNYDNKGIEIGAMINKYIYEEIERSVEID